MSVISKAKLLKLLESSDEDSRIVLTPLLSRDQIGNATVDFRLGTTLLYRKRSQTAVIDVTDALESKRRQKHLYEKVRLRLHEPFVLHPKELVLASTLEYLGLPMNVFAIVASRSSWGRLGKVVATAAMVQPGYRGCLTLELTNLGDRPMRLYPGLLIGHIAFFEVSPKLPRVQYRGRYDCPTEPEMSRFFHTDSPEESFWGLDGVERNLD